jgi:hypothetical protein
VRRHTSLVFKIIVIVRELSLCYGGRVRQSKHLSIFFLFFLSCPASQLFSLLYQ